MHTTAIVGKWQSPGSKSYGFVQTTEEKVLECNKLIYEMRETRIEQLDAVRFAYFFFHSSLVVVVVFSYSLPRPV